MSLWLYLIWRLKLKGLGLGYENSFSDILVKREPGRESNLFSSPITVFPARTPITKDRSTREQDNKRNSHDLGFLRNKMGVKMQPWKPEHVLGNRLRMGCGL